MMTELQEHILNDETMMTLLQVVEALDLPDAWVAAGTVRNFIWNILMGKGFDTDTDVDLVFFDPERSGEETQRLETVLEQAYPAYRWELSNQAHLHLYSPNTAPYQSTCDAVSRYPERCTAIAVRLDQGELEVFAPYGLEDLSAFIIRPTPHFLADDLRMALYWERLEQKNWQEKWPQLKILDR